ncbi:hypothetical protein IR152_10985 [Clostridioides sp. ES-S-0108-01]|uniref:hypothetical protein n=1 Tax=Clostridioides sp. ES-S-0108-01 TaxID=2770773 RepID=UPI001D0C4D69|nr:hypothetical protein [Clostridioides sp. ES-S-0108-01]
MADKLKSLAEKDERSLRLYCKRVLQLHADEIYNNNIDIDEANTNNQNETAKKRKVGALKPQK